MKVSIRNIFLILLNRIKLYIFLFSLLFAFSGYSQSGKEIKVYFLYGSRPAHPNKNHEKHYFGGIHGGHVSFGIDSVVEGFSNQNGFHIFPHRKNLKGIWKSQTIKEFVTDTVGSKYTTFTLPLTDSQFVKLESIIKDYFIKTPYDYAFFGMRCAAASYDLMSQIGLFKMKSRCCNVSSNFYPRRVRNKMFKLAAEKHYKISRQQGKMSRKWEKDI